MPNEPCLSLIMHIAVHLLVNANNHHEHAAMLALQMLRDKLQTFMQLETQRKQLTGAV